MSNQQTITINADVIATLKGMDKVVNGLKSGLSEANTKIDFTKGAGSSISKLVDKFKNEFSKFNQLTESGQLKVGDTKEALRSGQNLINTYRELQRIIGDFKSLTVVDAKKLFPDAFDQRIDATNQKLKDYVKQLDKINEKTLNLEQEKRALESLRTKYNQLNETLKDRKQLDIDTIALTKAKEKVEDTQSTLLKFKKDIQDKIKLTIDSKDFKDKLQDLYSQQEKLQKKINNSKVQDNGRTLRYKGATEGEWNTNRGKAKEASSNERTGALRAINNYSQNKQELENVNQQIAAAERLQNLFANIYTYSNKKINGLLTEAGFSPEDIQKFQEAMLAAKKATDDQASANEKLKQTASQYNELIKTQQDIDKKQQAIEKLKNTIESLQGKLDFSSLQNAFKDLEIDITPEMLKNEKGVESLKNKLHELDNQKLVDLIQNLEKMGISSQQAKDFVQQLSGRMVELGNTASNIDRANQEMEQLKNQVLQFFSIGNAVQLFKRAVKSAFDTVKELDATMTETAVVTDFTVSNMWGQLPTYAAEANKLGAAINDLYGSTTLYYQQGLQTKAAMALGIETTKMARIANIEAADATNLMTAALRGFNMELNETSAQKVNDIYSELAAITAADTQEIGVAMSKTASIASSANMELETTAALLSQIIETTREAPETAGTAMKTIIARFSEVKKLISQGQLTGEDTEGEIIDVNKIQGALRSVGISMNEFFAGTEGLDDVLLKLASKWDTLDFTTQRYIATTAAGSRQQSRFIAMMSDYSRTQELVSAAYNSTGASQEQFEKTLDSLDAKLTKLKNAWDQFAMGLANNEFIKGTVDVLTFLLNTLNSIIDTISGGNGVIKSLVSLGIAFSVFKGIKSLLNGSKFGGSIISNLFGGKGKAEAEAGQIGRQAGNSFITNFKKRIQNVKDNGLVKGLFSKDMAIELKKGADFSQVYSGLDDAQKIALSKNEKFKEAYLNSFYELNNDDITLGDNLKQVSNAFDIDGIDAANAKVQELGGNIQITEEMADAASQTMGTDFKAVANAAGVAGAAIIGMASALEADGASEELVGVIKAIGTALIALPAIFQLVSAAAKAFSIDVSASIMNIPIIGWIAAIISALIALAGILSSVIETDDEKMKRLSEETNRAKEAAEAASNAYSELKDSLSGIDEANKTLDNLVYGTQAWTEALLKVNEQVLDLITLYPQLMQYVTQGEYGQLEIRAEGTEKLLEQQLTGVQNAQQGQLIAAAKETQFKAQAEKNNILIDIALDHTGVTEEVYNGLETETTTQYLDDEYIFDQISSFIKDNPLEMVNIANEEYSDAIYQAANAVGLSVDDFAELAKSIQSFDKTLGITETQVQSSIANTIRSDLSEASKQSRYVNQVVSGLSKGYSENIEQDVTDEKNTLTGKDSETNISSLAKELRGQGYDITSTDKNLETYQQVYAALSGRALSDVKEADYSEDDLATMIAEIQQGNEYAANTEEIIAKIDQLAVINKTAADKAAAILSNDFSSLTKEQIAELEKLKTGDDLKQQLIDWGILSANATEEELSAFLNKLGVDSFDALLKQTQDTASGTTKQFNNLVSDNFRGDNVEIASKLIEGATFGEAKSITDALNNAEAKGGDAAFDSLSSIITQLNNTDIDEEEYRALLESLSSYDFSDPGQIEAFLDKVKEIAPNLPTSELDKWEKSLTESYSAVKTFSLENLKDELKNTLDLIDGIKDRDSAKFDDEEYQQLISAGADKNDFIWNGQDWIYIGGTMEELASILEANTSAVLENTIALLKNQIESGSQFNEGYQILEQTRAYNETELELFRTGGFTNANDIASMYKSMGIDSIMDAKTGNYFNIEDLLKLDGGDDRLVELYQSQANDATNLISNKEKLNDTEGIIGGLDNQIAASISQAEDAGLNTNELIAYRDSLIDITEKSKEVETLSEAMATEIARDNMMMNKAISELSDNWDTWSKALKNSNKDTPEYSIALNSLRNNMKNMLGITSDLSDKFLTNSKNMALMGKAAKGDISAVNLLRKEASKEILFGVSFDKDKLTAEEQEVLSLIDNFNPDDIKIGATLDSSGITDAFNSLIESGIMTADQVSQALESIGYEPEITYKEVPVNQVHFGRQTATAEVLDPLTGEKKTVTAENISEFAENGMVRIPVINGSTTKFKGSAPKVTSPSTTSGKGSGGGGSKQDTKTWKNPYDKFYNTTEKINELLRQRNKLENEFSKLASRSATTTDKLNKNLKSQLKNLESQVKSQKILINGKRKQLQNAANATMSVEGGKVVSFQQAFKKAGGSGSITRYGKYNEATGQIEIDWAGLEALQAKDAEQGEAVEAYIGYLENISGEFEDAQDTLIDIEDEIIAIADAQLEARNDLTTALRDALVQQYQNEIDKLSELNDTINESNTNILNGIQESIDLSRQIRDNTETEQDIAEKEAKLAFLRRDTSGANDLEIKQLEEELKDARQSYSDTLIDQEIDRLSKQNDDDAEARQKQIDLMQKQLDYWTESGYFNDEVNAMIKALDNSDLANKALNIWKEMQGYDTKTESEKIALMKEWDNLWKKGRAGSAVVAAEDNMIKGDEYTLKNKKGKPLGSGFKYNSKDNTWSNGTITVSGSDIDSADIDDNILITSKTKKELLKKPPEKTPDNPGDKNKEDYPYGKASETSGNIKQGAKGNAVKAIQYALNKLGYGNSGTSSVDGIFGPNTTKAVKAFQKAMGIKPDGIIGTNTREKFKAKKYLTGGLADYTGLAWLDGSKSKPELVLNARDTQNFIVLKDVLADLVKNGTTKQEKFGDNYYDFHINIEQIANDYDVEKMIQKVKDEINKDSIYRNVNSINFMR